MLGVGHEWFRYGTVFDSYRHKSTEQGARKTMTALTRRSASRSHNRNRIFLGTPEILQTDALCRVVVGVVLVATVLTRELLAVAVGVMG